MVAHGVLAASAPHAPAPPADCIDLSEFVLNYDTKFKSEGCYVQNPVR